MADIDKDGALNQLKERINKLDPLKDEPDFLCEQTLRRYLVARAWNVDAAEKLLISTLEWRREIQPQKMVCTYCNAQPGFHCMRQVGFDKIGRPTLYSTFIQSLTQNNMIEDSMQHLVYLVENAKHAMSKDVHQFVWIIDLTGMHITSCNPRMALAMEKILSRHYPERMGTCVIVNPGVLFYGFWRAVKNFIDPATTRKIYVEKSDHKIETIFSELFSEELHSWLLEEIRLNKSHPLPKSQKEFWLKPDTGHDPRGCESYVKKYLETSSAQSLYKPHPNILTVLLEKHV